MVPTTTTAYLVKKLEVHWFKMFMIFQVIKLVQQEGIIPHIRG